LDTEATLNAGATKVEGKKALVIPTLKDESKGEGEKEERRFKPVSFATILQTGYLYPGERKEKRKGQEPVNV